MPITLGDMVYWIRGNSSKLSNDLQKSEDEIEDFGENVSSSLKEQLNFAFGQVMAEGMRTLSDGLKRFTTDLVNTVTEYGNQMQDLQLVTGQSVEDTSRLFSVMEDLGIPFEGLIGAFSQYSTFLERTNSTMDLSIESMAQLADQYLALEEGVQRTNFITERFGDTGVKLRQLLELGSEGILEMAGAVDHLFTQEQLDAIDEYEAVMSDFDRTIRDLKLQVAPFLLDALKDFTTWVKDNGVPAIQGLIDWFTKLSEPIQNVIKWFLGILTVVTALAPQLLALKALLAPLGPILANVFGWLGAITGLAAAVEGLGVTLMTLIVTPVGQLLLLIGLLIVAINLFGKEALNTFKMIWKIFETLLGRAFARQAQRAGTNIGKAWVSGIMAGIAAAFPALASAIGSLRSYFNQSVPTRGTTAGTQQVITAANAIQPISLAQAAGQNITVQKVEFHGSFSDAERAWLTRNVEIGAGNVVIESMR